jgi:hypothetical protein
VLTTAVRRGLQVFQVAGRQQPAAGVSTRGARVWLEPSDRDPSSRSLARARVCVIHVTPPTHRVYKPGNPCCQN